MQRILATVMLTCSVLLLARGDDSQPSETSRYYCGKKLVTKLNEECKHIFKRNRPDSTAVLGLAGDRMFMVRGDAVSLVGRRKRGVVTECCRKPCTITELTSYCGEPE